MTRARTLPVGSSDTLRTPLKRPLRPPTPRPGDDRRALAFVARVAAGSHPLDALGDPNVPYARASPLIRARREQIVTDYMDRRDHRQRIARVSLIRGNVYAVRLILQWEILEGSTRDARVAKTRMEMLTGRMAAASSRPARPGAGNVEEPQEAGGRRPARTLGLPVPESTTPPDDGEALPADPPDDA